MLYFFLIFMRIIIYITRCYKLVYYSRSFFFIPSWGGCGLLDKGWLFFSLMVSCPASGIPATVYDRGSDRPDGPWFLSGGGMGSCTLCGTGSF